MEGKRSRGFEIVTKYENSEIKIPFRKTQLSAGYDFAAVDNVEIKPGEVCLVPTGIKAYMLKGEVLKIYARSSLAINKKLMMANNVAIIDADYYNNDGNEGEIFISLFNFGNKTATIARGERVAQGVFETFLITDDDNLDDSATKTKRVGGFGSTGNL